LRICLVDYPLLSTQESEELPEFINGPVRDMLGIIPPEVTSQTSKLSISDCRLRSVQRRRRSSRVRRDDCTRGF